MPIKREFNKGDLKHLATTPAEHYDHFFNEVPILQMLISHSQSVAQLP
jgi:hypothetical protein